MEGPGANDAPVRSAAAGGLRHTTNSNTQGGHVAMRAAAKGGHRPSISARAAIKYLLVLAGVAFATQVRAECSRVMRRLLAET